MKKLLMIIITILIIGNIPAFAYESLLEVYDQAGGYGEYDKWLELDPDVEYLGNLSIAPGVNVYINGHGALIHGRTNSGAICVSNSHLDIENCVIIDGHAGFYIGAGASAVIKNNTIKGMVDSGIRTFYINGGVNSQIYNNIITDCYYGIYGIENEIPQYIGFNTIYNTGSYRYAELCPGWGGDTVNPMYPGPGDQNLDPLFIDADNNDFCLQENSPCRNSGRYDEDRGALFGQTSIESKDIQPDNFILASNYPNPFNASTIIEFSLQNQSFVTIEIYDMLGRSVAKLVSDDMSAGSHQVVWNANHQTSGVYFYSINADGFTQTKKMSLLK